MSYKLWGGYFFPSHAPIYGAGDMIDKHPFMYMSSIQNDIDINNIIFNHFHEQWRAVRRQG